MERLYIVTGAFGHLGNNLVKELVRRGEKVRCLALPGENTASLIDVDIEVINGDVRDKASLLPLFQTESPCQLMVIHCAGIVTIASHYNQNVVDVNVNGTKNMVEMCIENRVDRMVYTSSVHAIPERPDCGIITEVDRFDPDAVEGLYAKTKAKASQIVLDGLSKGLDAVIVHPSGIIGPNDYGNGHLTQMIIDYCNGSLKAMIQGGYDFVDVRDVVDGIISAMEHGRKGECYILSNRFFTVAELFQLLHEISGKKQIKTILPRWFINLTAPVAELYYKILHRTPLFTSYSMYTLFCNAKYSHAKADRELNYTPRDMRVTLADTIQFLRENGRIRD